MNELVDLFRALADPTRLRIVALLAEMELAVGELAQLLEQSQPRVSRHVKILCDAGLIVRRREGSWMFLAPAQTPLAEPLSALFEGTEWRAADLARLDAVRAERVRAAERFFAAHAEEWDRLRGLHASDEAVEARMRALLAGPLGRMVDLGTGTGRMLELFAPQASRATGIDRSPEMLRLARVKLDGCAGYELRQGDVSALPLADATADTVIVHQVLHYLAEPGQAVAEAARILAPGGRLLIVDFAAHDRDELRDQAHVRLGFDDAQIAGWASAAGLTLDATETLDGGPLTVKIWRAVRPAVRERLAA